MWWVHEKEASKGVFLWDSSYNTFLCQPRYQEGAESPTLETTEFDSSLSLQGKEYCVLWMNHFCADIMQDAAFNILRPLFFWAFIFVFVSIFIIEKTNTFCNLTSSYVSSSQTSPDPKDWATWVTIKGPLGGRNLIIQKVLKPKKSITSPHLEEGEQLP